MHSTTAALLFSSLAAATPSALFKRDPFKVPAGTSAIATFNDYVAQGTVDCQGDSYGPFAQSPFAAATGDLSKDLSLKPNGGCGAAPAPGTPDYNAGCADPNAHKPSCSSVTPCNTCYLVTNSGGAVDNGFWNGAPVPADNSQVVVKVVDTCPNNNPQNYCKPASIALNQRCMQPGQNALDIDVHAYQVLTGGKIDYVAALAAYQQDNTKPLPPNLLISVQSVACDSAPPAAGGQGKSAAGKSAKGATAKKAGGKAGGSDKKTKAAPAGKTASKGKAASAGKDASKSAKAAPAGAAKPKQ